MIAIRFVSLHSLFDSILGDIQHERGGGDRKEIKYFKRRIAAVNSISLEMAIWKIDQFHPLALASACTESAGAVDGWQDCRYLDSIFQIFYFPEKTVCTQDNMLALPLKIEGMSRAGIG